MRVQIRKMFSVLPVAFCILCFSFIPQSFAKELKDGIIAVVNSDVITLSDLMIYLNSHYTQLKLEGRSEAEIQKIMSELQNNGLNKLIEEKLILAEANKKEMTIRADAIDKRVAEIKSHYPSEQAFTAAISATGATVTDLRNKITDQFKLKYFIDDEVRSKVVVNPQEVTDYYNTHQEEFNTPERIDLDSIYISYANTKEAAQNKLAEVDEAIKAGKDFKEVAKQYSESASIGTVSRGQMLPAIEDVIFQLKDNEISEPVEVSNGIYIFKLNKKYPAQTAPIDEVKDKINDGLSQIKFQEKYKAWIEKLKKKAFVEIK